MINFEEQFPSLDTMEFENSLEADDPYCSIDENKLKELLIQNCLDKQRVREAIDKVFPKGFQYSDGYKEQLLKELKL